MPFSLSLFDITQKIGAYFFITQISNLKCKILLKDFCPLFTEVKNLILAIGIPAISI